MEAYSPLSDTGDGPFPQEFPRVKHALPQVILLNVNEMTAGCWLFPSQPGPRDLKGS